MAVQKPTKDKGEPAKRRRTRAPQPVILRLCTDLADNEDHPLARLDPAVRNEQRQRLIASILARLASGPSSLPAAIGTMTEADPGTENTSTASESR